MRQGQRATMSGMCKGRYKARFATSEQDVQAAQALRHKCFRGGGTGCDADAFDPLCQHVLVEDAISGVLCGCFRLMLLDDGQALGGTYSAQFYDLSALKAFPAPMVEMGRFCIDPDTAEGADILRVAWGAVTRYVDEANVGILFGCTSFQGTDEAPYNDTFALLQDKYGAPRRWSPCVKAPKVISFAQAKRGPPDRKRAISGLPPLLRSYLMMGGWVSDHAVVDDDLETLHVFTAIEIAAVPPTRARLLRADAANV